MQQVLKCLYIIKLIFIERITYRVNFFLQVLSSILSSLIVVFLWMAIYRQDPGMSLGGFTLAEMVTYILGGGLINSFILTTAESNETSQGITEGVLSGLLVQPMSPYWVWFFRDMGTKIFLLLMGLLSYGVVFLFFRDLLIISIDPGTSAIFMISLGLAVLLQYFLFESLSLLAFWMENTYGIRFTMRVIMEVLGGAIIPISFFPGLLRDLFLALPFPYLVYYPMTIYLGKMSFDQAIHALGTECLWIAGLGFVNFTLWKQGLKRYVAQGD